MKKDENLEGKNPESGEDLEEGVHKKNSEPDEYLKESAYKKDPEPDENLGESVSQKDPDDQEKKGRDKNLKKLILACGILAVVMAVICIWQLARFYGRERDSEAKVEQLRQIMEGMGLVEEEDRSPWDIADMKESVLPENPYAELFARNEDMAAWLVVDGTAIDYPVMQTMEDENYYLKRDFDGNEDEAGCLILDTDSDLYGSGTVNLIIHGHNMKAGTMFGSLDEYKDENYYSEHKYMELYTEKEKRRYEVMAVFYSQVYFTTDQVFKYYKFFQAQDEEEFRYFYDNVKKMSLYDTGVTAKLGDNFLTLSTCTYHVEDGRFVVVAKEIERPEEYTEGA